MEAKVSFERKAQLAESALTVLETYEPEKKSMLSPLEGKKLVEKMRLIRWFPNETPGLETACLRFTTHDDVFLVPFFSPERTRKVIMIIIYISQRAWRPSNHVK